MHPGGGATGAVGRSLGDTCRGEDARRGSSSPRFVVRPFRGSRAAPSACGPRCSRPTRLVDLAFACVWASLLPPRLSCAPTPPALLALYVRAYLLPHRLPLCTGPAGLSSRGGGVGFGEGLGEGGILAPCEEGSGGGFQPRYLGSVLQKDGDIDEDVRHRISAGWLKWHPL